jgi:drug/metabolite transporter (DMT)-like permease
MSAGSAVPAQLERTDWWIGMALAIAGAVLFSGKAVIVKLAYRHGADPVSLIALRMLFALPFFVIAAWWVGRRRSPAAAADAAVPAADGGAVWQRGDALRIAALGLIGYYLASFLDFLGLQYVSASLGRIIAYLNPTLVLLISFLWLRRRIGPREWIALAVAYVGVLTVYWHDLQLGGSNVPLGSFLVLLSAMLYAIYLVAGGAMVRRIGPIRLTAWASIVACFACIAQAVVLDPTALFAQAPAVYWLSLVNGTACTVIPIFCVMMAIDRIGSGPVALLGAVGPVSTIAMAAAWLGEPVSAIQLAGTGIVLSAIAILSLRRS